MKNPFKDFIKIGERLFQSLVFVCFLFISLPSSAQITEGKAIALQSMSSPDSSMQQYLSIFKDQELTNYFKGSKVRQEFFGAFAGNTITIFDYDLGKGIALQDDPDAGKFYTLIDLDSMKQDSGIYSQQKTNDTATIAGYLCTKFIITNNQDSTIKTTVWRTFDINTYTINMPTHQYEGAILKYEISAIPNFFNTPIIITYEVLEIIECKVADEKFDLSIPEGYTLKPSEN